MIQKQSKKCSKCIVSNKPIRLFIFPYNSIATYSVSIENRLKYVKKTFDNYFENAKRKNKKNQLYKI